MKADRRVQISLIVGLVALFLVPGMSWAQEPVPFECTGQAFIVQDPPSAGINGQLTAIDQSVTPFTFTDVGTPQVEYNNIGFRSTDGFIYGVELTTGGNNGIVRIDSGGNVINLGVPAGLPDVRFDAGDVSPDGNTLFISLISLSTLYKLDLTALPTLNITTQTITGKPAGADVHDWCYNPVTNTLFGGNATSGNLAMLDINDISGNAVWHEIQLKDSLGNNDFLPTGTAYGGAWANAIGWLFIYRNSGTIFTIDTFDPDGPTIVSSQSGPGSTRNDAAACAAEVPSVEIEKTVYEGWDSGASAPGGEFVENPTDGKVTYVFTVTNTGDVNLYNILINDADLGIVDSSGLTLIPGLSDPYPPLAPGGKLVYYIEFTVEENLVNEGCVTGNTVETPREGDIVDDCDTAIVLTECPEVPPPVGEGCTPGYWKHSKHFDSWVTYSPDDYFDVVFGVGPHMMLKDVLAEGGGGQIAFNRHAVAALLNAANPDVDYAYDVAEVIAIVVLAYSSGDYEGQKMLLERQNESGCPLN